MKNINLADAPRAYHVSPSRLERVLSQVGWLRDGELQAAVIAKGYVTAQRELTPQGQGYLDEVLREHRA